MPQWVRKGECSNCGYCCRMSFDPVTLFFPRDHGKRDELLRVRGFISMRQDGTSGLVQNGLIYLPCPQHINNRCAIFNSPLRPRMCHDFPEKPSQVVDTPCSYWFEDLEGKELPIGGEGSPHGRGSEVFPVPEDVPLRPVDIEHKGMI